jgi:hypothetical protein
MKIYNGLEELTPQLEGAFLFFDTSSLIAILEIPELLKIFEDLKNSHSVAFVTIKSVVFEFTRANNLASYNARTNFLNGFLTVYPIEQYLSSLQETVITLHKTVGAHLSYPDFLLYCSLIKVYQSYLVTENHKDFTPVILNRLAVITVDDEKSYIRNTGIYQIASDKYLKVAKKIDPSPKK